MGLSKILANYNIKPSPTYQKLSLDWLIRPYTFMPRNTKPH